VLSSTEPASSYSTYCGSNGPPLRAIPAPSAARYGCDPGKNGKLLGSSRT
jgi:hypothetical protein